MQRLQLKLDEDDACDPLDPAGEHTSMGNKLRTKGAASDSATECADDDGRGEPATEEADPGSGVNGAEQLEIRWLSNLACHESPARRWDASSSPARGWGSGVGVSSIASKAMALEVGFPRCCNAKQNT